MKAVLEGLLFLVGEDGLTVKEMMSILECDENQVLDLLNELTLEYNSADRGVELKKFGEIYKLTTKEEYRSYYEKLANIETLRDLSQQALETLAIIAYNEPITRMEVDEIRGVASSQMIRNLVAKDFIKEVGKKQTVGHPTLYGITDEFLNYFGLSSKEQLPKLEEIEESSSEEQDLYQSKYHEEPEIL